jgi:hypothetical protein
MAYVPPPDPACSPVPLGVQGVGSFNNARANIPVYPAPAGINDTGPTRTPAVPPPTPTPQARTAIAYGVDPFVPKVTRTATQTATASNPINPVDYPASILKRGDIDTGLSLPSNIFGPYPQTMFLGCSVVSFNVSLGWGNQPSSLSVTLVEDTGPHYVMTHDGGIYKQTALGLQTSVNHYYNTLKPRKDATTGVINETAAAYKNRVASFLDTNGNLIVPGKIFYHYNESLGKLEQKYWLGPDPGFIGSRNKFRRNGRITTGTDPITGKQNIELGEQVDIIGCPIYFQLDDFNFCGVVKSWRSVNSGTGGRTYQVDIEGPNEIINQTQIILNNYTGGVFVKSTLSEGEATLGDVLTGGGEGEISGPSDDIWSSKISLSEAFKGNMTDDGNIPNIINIYGFLEAMAPGGFGGAGINDEGLNTNSIIYTINYLLSLPTTATAYEGQTTRSIFSPFGALVGRSPMTGTPKSDETLNMRIYRVGDSDIPAATNDIYPVNYNNGTTNPAIGFPNSRKREFSAAGLSVAGTVSGFLEIGDDGTVARNTSTPPGVTAGTKYNIFDFGLLPPDDVSSTIPAAGEETGIDNQNYKQLYYLDLGELPAVPMQLRTDCNQSIVDLNTFITEICDKSGIDFFYEMLYIKVYASSPAVKIIKLRTVTRRVQPSDRAISDYIARLRDAGVPVSSVSLGKEYNSSAKPRTILIGGRQQRLFQTKNYGLAYRASDYIYHCTEKKLLHYSTDDDRAIPNAQMQNFWRVPNPGSVRDPYALARTTSISKHNEIPVDDYYERDYSWSLANILELPIFGNYITSSSTGDLPAVTVDTVEKKSESPDLSTSEKFLLAMGKTIFDWGYTQIIEKSKNENFSRNLHMVNPFWTTPWSTTSQYTSSEGGGGGGGGSSNSITQTPEATILDNFASAIADIGYNTFNKHASYYLENRGSKFLRNKDYDQAGWEGGWKIDDANTRFFPIMYNSICPFFGTTDYIDKSKNQYNLIDKTRKPRCVWFDTWQNNLVIEFNVRELPITKLELEGIYNGGNFYVTESELRAAIAGWDSWIGYMSMRIHDPHIKQMIKNATCGDREIPPPPKPTPPDRTRTGPPAPSAADNGKPANLGGQGDNKPQQQDTKSDSQVTSDNDWDACAIFTSIFKISSSFNEKTKSSSAGASVPKNTKSGLNFALTADLKLLHEFFRKIGDEFYGRKFMVRIPMILSYRDRSSLINMDPRPTPTPAPASNTAPANPNDSDPNSPGRGNDGSSIPNATANPGAQAPSYVNIGTADNPRYITEGNGKIYSNYKTSPEGAWEEYGNTIDDSLMIGGYAASIFTDEQGKIQTILGFPANDRFDHESYKICEWIKENVCKMVNGPNIFYLYDVLKRGNVFSNASRYTEFDGSKPRETGCSE